MVKKRKNKGGHGGAHGNRSSGMDVDATGGEQGGWKTGPVADMDTSDGPQGLSAKANTIPKEHAARGQKLKVQKKRKKMKLANALARAEQAETKVAKQTSKHKKKLVLKSLY